MPSLNVWWRSERRGRLRIRLLCVLFGGLAAALAADKIPAAAGDIEITPLTHASVQLEYAGKVIQVDPVQVAAKADLILITGPENDHLDPATIAKLRKAGAP